MGCGKIRTPFRAAKKGVRDYGRTPFKITRRGAEKSRTPFRSAKKGVRDYPHTFQYRQKGCKKVAPIWHPFGAALEKACGLNPHTFPDHQKRGARKLYPFGAAEYWRED